MIKAFGIVLLLALAGCATAPPASSSPSACSADPASYACQVELYAKAGN